MIKHYLLIFLMCFIHSITVAQNAVVMGTILDKSTQEAIPFASALLINQADSTIFFGGISDVDGNFIIKKIPNGNYKLRLSYIGYSSEYFENLHINKGDNYIGRIYLRLSNKQIGEVVIKGSTPPVSYKVDRKVINVENFPNASVAIDLLENIPSIQLDYAGNLTYRGDGTFKVFINGNPAANGVEKLRQLPVDRIKNIEIITNPPARYSSEGTAGVILVNLKKSRLPGYAISTHYTHTTLGTDVGGFSIDKQGEKDSWYLNGSIGEEYWYKRNNTSKQITNYNDTMYTVNSIANLYKKRNRGYIELGYTRDLSQKDYIDFSFYFSPIDSEEETNSEGITREAKHTGNIIDELSYTIKNNANFSYNYIGGDLKYKHNFGSKDNTDLLNLFLGYSSYLHPSEDMSVDTKEYKDRTERTGYIGKEYNEVVINGSIGYEKQLRKNTTLEIGGEVSLDYIPKLSSESGYINDSNELIVFPNEPKKQEVDFKQNIYASYLTFKGAIKNLEYKIGFRTEFTDRKSNYKYLENNETKNIDAKEQFVDFFPSIHVMRNFSDTHQLAMSYSRRINRPNYWNLIPLRQYENPYLYQVGNANLQPAYTNNLELNYKKSWDNNFIAVELFARQTQGVIQYYRRIESENILIEAPENVGNSWSVGTELMFGYDITQWWSINCSTSLFDYRLNVHNAQNAQKQLRSDSRFNNSFVLPSNFTFKFDVYYRSPNVTAQGTRSMYCYSNFSVKKTMFNKKWSLAMSYLNAFNSIKYKSISEGENFYRENNVEQKPYLMFKISYMFNNQK